MVLQHGHDQVRLVPANIFSKKVFNKLKWKIIKDSITLAKNWTEVCKSLIIWYRTVEKEKKLYKQLEEYDAFIVGPN